MPSPCQHEDFITVANIFRLSAETGGSITGFTAEINIRCSECGQEFEWIGPNMGSSPFEPTVSFDGTVLRAPIKPATARVLAPQEGAQG